jgi:ubiquinone/menaquinone biosynthesis C-methylase UbiE
VGVEGSSPFCSTNFTSIYTAGLRSWSRLSPTQTSLLETKPEPGRHFLVELDAWLWFPANQTSVVGCRIVSMSSRRSLLTAKPADETSPPSPSLDTGRSADGGVFRHFQTFSEEYDQSTEWCSDPQFITPLSEGTVARRILDLGCGTGLVTETLRAEGRKVLGLDLAYPMLRKAKSRVGPTLVAGNAEYLPFQTGSLDLIVCRQMLHYTREAEVLCEAARVLRTGGEFRLAQVTSRCEQDFLFWSIFKTITQPLRRRSYSPDLLRSILERCCFDVQEVRHLATRRYYTFERIFRYAPLPERERETFLAWMRGELHRLHDLIEPAWSQDGMTINQFWTVFMCVKRG